MFVGDWHTESVCLVNVSTDTVIRKLEGPAEAVDYPSTDPVIGLVKKRLPCDISLLGQTVLVCYGHNTLVTYRSDSPTSGRVLQTPEGLQRVRSITTDSYSSSFLVTDHHAVYVLSDNLITAYT